MRAECNSSFVAPGRSVPFDIVDIGGIASRRWNGDHPHAVPRLLVCYHFFHPDDVVSAQMFSGLAVEQVRRGWDVTALACNRSWRDPHARLPAQEEWNGVHVHRVFRPPWDQARPGPRLANSAWMLAAWFLRTLKLGRFDAIVIGSDPAFSPLGAIALRLAYPTSALVHWCFDLYPEAIVADGTAGATLLPRFAQRLMGLAYRRCDALVDIGPRMRERLADYASGARQETLVPWALTEADRPVAIAEDARHELFPRARLALLYAGTMGRAHDFQSLLRLARACRARSGDAVSLCFAVRGNRAQELRAAIGPDDTNVNVADFADEQSLLRRLAAADLHLISLRGDWAGIVVPSKFFASLAVGRPVLYAGPDNSEIARWIAADDLGLHLREDDIGATADRLHALIGDEPALARWRENALAVYRRRWSKNVTNDHWDRLLRELVSARE
jgi:glycosyltransferase involved in cell wall biosynthesis